MAADPEPSKDLSLMSCEPHDLLIKTSNTSQITPTQSQFQEPEHFPFLSLPLELRLKIYGYLLPPRTHTVVTQLPNNGLFYNSSINLSVNYPFGCSAQPNGVSKTHGNRVIYKILNTNFRSSYAEPSIYPMILRVSRQVLAEAEPVLYAAPDTIFNIGTHLGAGVFFFSGCSQSARASIRNIRLAREVPFSENTEDLIAPRPDARWLKLCDFVRRELVGLKELDLTLWSSSGSVASFPTALDALPSINPDVNPVGFDEQEVLAEEEMRVEAVQKWRNWEWTRELLGLDSLKKATITWWDFKSVKGTNGKAGFDIRLAGRMVEDKLVRDRAIREGVVLEGKVEIRGKAA